MLLTTKEIFKTAHKGGYAVGAFNVFNLESIQAVFRAARNKRSPIVVNVSEKSLRYAGTKNIVAIVKTMAEEYEEVPCAMQLDHGKSFEVVEEMILAGFRSVMIDGSRFPYKDNVEVTKKVISLAKNYKVGVQAELGVVPYLGEKIEAKDLMTRVEDAEKFVKETKVDALAVAIGNAHGFIKEEHLDIERVGKISRAVGIPLVLHGASDFPRELACRAIENGVACFHIDTEIRVSYVDALRTAFRDVPLDLYDPRYILPIATTAMQDAVQEKMTIFGSVGKI